METGGEALDKEGLVAGEHGCEVGGSVEGGRGSEVHVGIRARIFLEILPLQFTFELSKVLLRPNNGEHG